MQDYFNSSKAYIVAIVIFLILAIGYMFPALDGKNIQQGDNIQFQGMSKEIVDYRAKTGDEPLWTNSAFGGMPAFMTSTQYRANKIKTLHNILTIKNWRPICFVFLYMLGFYIALLAFGVNPWLAIVGAIAYAFSSYFFIIIEAGHNSKVFALGYMPAIIAGFHLAFRGKYLLGSALFGLFLALQINIIHLQITYYTFMIVGIYAIFELVKSVREKQLQNLFKASLGLLLFAMLAVASNTSTLWTSYEYSKFSTRSKSELTNNSENKTTGLDKDYITQWSIGMGETFTLMIPNFKGGPSANELSENSHTFEFFKKVQGASNAKQSIKQVPTYWGPQPFTSPVYFGAIVCFLFVFGLFLVKGNLKWWLLLATLLSIMLSMGYHLVIPFTERIIPLTDFFLDHVPGYNKFRAVSMTLVIAAFAMPLLGILAINEVIKGIISKEEVLKALKYSFYIVGGLCLIFILFAGAFSYESLNDENYLAQGYTDFVDALRKDRLVLLRKDALRSLIFISLAGASIYLLVKEKIKTNQFIAILGLFILVDMWAVDKRYLNNDNFVSKKQYKNPISKTKADEMILRDPDPNYKVLNMAVNTFNDGTTSYFHKSIGGYHGAKMKRYKELIDFNITPETQVLMQAMRTSDMQKIDEAFAKMSAINMLNTKYVIYNKEAAPLYNKYAMGNAWFVNDFILVDNADEELAKLAGLDLRNLALIDVRYKDLLTNFGRNSFDSTATIALNSYAPNSLEYTYNSKSNALVVFSEIYYPKGWKMTIDGNPAEHFSANYVLRAAVLPAGNHVVKFFFHPDSYYKGENVTLVSSLLLILLFFGAIGFQIKKSLLSSEGV